MALIQCPDCKRQVSSEARSCPSCGYPIAERVHDGAIAEESAPSNGLLMEVRPSWWNYFWHFVFGWLLVPVVVAILRRNATVLQVYSDRVALRRGLLTTEFREFFIRDIRSIDVDQTFWARMFGIGDLTISTAATVDAADVIAGIPNPLQVKDLIISRRQAVTGSGAA